MAKSYPVRFEVREQPDGWRLMAMPANGVGWAPIPMTPPRGTPGGALVEFASALYLLTQDDPLYLKLPLHPGPETTETKEKLMREMPTSGDATDRATAPADVPTSDRSAQMEAESLRNLQPPTDAHIDAIVNDIVACAYEEDGGKLDARMYCHELIRSVRQQTKAALAEEAKNMAAAYVDYRGPAEGVVPQAPTSEK